MNINRRITGIQMPRIQQQQQSCGSQVARDNFQVEIRKL